MLFSRPISVTYLPLSFFFFKNLTPNPTAAIIPAAAASPVLPGIAET